MGATPKKAILVSMYHVALLLINSATIFLFIYVTDLNKQDYKNIFICFSFGMIGGTLNASRYVIKAVKQNKYDEKRILWQVLTPVHSGIFSVIAIAFFKSGINLAVTNTSAKGPNYLEFIAIISFLVGFSTEIFTKKLIAATEALYGEKRSLMNNDND